MRYHQQDVSTNGVYGEVEDAGERVFVPPPLDDSEKRHRGIAQRGGQRRVLYPGISYMGECDRDYQRGEIRHGGAVPPRIAGDIHRTCGGCGRSRRDPS